MSDYISREAAIKARHNCSRNCAACDFAIEDDSWCEGEIWAVDILRVPAADVRPVVRGKWINQRADSEMCSACGVRFYISALFAVGGNDEPNYCPNCGARMDGEA